MSSVPAGSESRWTVFVTDEERARAGSMVIEWQRKRALAAFDRRRKGIVALDTPEAVRAWALRARRAFIDSIGGLPEQPCPLDARLLDTLDRGDYLLQKVVYQSRPDYWIPANLYLPKGLDGQRVPAVLAPMGHTAAGKGARWLQERCIGLVRQGYVVLTYDQPCLGERWEYYDADSGLSLIGHRRPDGLLAAGPMSTTLEHWTIGNQLWLTGDSLAQHVVWDAVRSTDYLVTRPEVDPRRIACSGASMGGLATMVLTAVDLRLFASMPVCHVTRRSHLVRLAMPRDAEQVFLGCYEDGWEHVDLLLPIGLRRGHLCVGANTQDFFPIEGAREAAEELRRLFSLLGIADQFTFAETDHTHGWSPAVYDALHAFLHRAFGRPGTPGRHHVTRTDTLPPEKTWCTPRGQLSSWEEGGRNLFALNVEKADRLRAQRRQSTPDRVLTAAQRLTGTHAVVDDQSARMIGVSDNVERWLLASEPGIELPLLALSPGDVERPTGAIVFASPEGKQVVFSSPAFPLERELSRGRMVAAIDVRGWGETSWINTPQRGEIDYMAPLRGGMSILTYNALRAGETMVGLWASDLLAVAHWLRQHVRADLPITLWGVGELGVAALHAAAVDDSVSRVVLHRSLLSYDEWVRTPLYRTPVTYVIPGVLAEYDLPELTCALATRPASTAVTWIDPVDATGATVPTVILERRIRSCLQRMGGAELASSGIDIVSLPGPGEWQRAP